MLRRSLSLSFVRVCLPWLALAPHFANAAEPAGGDVPADTARVEPIVVTGSRTEQAASRAPVSTVLISAEDIAASGARSLGELLEEQAGVQLDRSVTGAGASLQGLPPDYTLVLVDGLRVPGRIDGVIDLDRFALEDVERVEVVRGSSSALYGSDAIGGVINIITRKAKRPLELDAQASAGARRRFDTTASLGTRREHWAARLTGGRHSGAGFDRDPSDPATTQSAFEQYDASTQASVAPGAGVRIELGASYMRRDRQGVDGNATGAIYDRQNLTEAAAVELRPRLDLGAGVRLQTWTSLGLFRDQFLLDQRGADALDTLQDTRERILQLGAQLELRPHSAHRLSVGTEGSQEALRTPRLSTGVSSRARGAVYAQDEWTLLTGPRLALVPGARLDVDSQFGVYATPRLAARFDPLGEVTVRASHGWGYKAPDFRELYLLFENPSAGYLVEGNPELEPETSRSVEASVEWRPHRSVRLSLSGFWTELSNRINTDLVPATDAGPQRFQYRNVAEARTRGVEVGGTLDPLTQLRVGASYALTDARDQTLERPLGGQAQHRATLHINFRAPAIGFEAGCRAALVGTRPFFDTTGDASSIRRDAPAYASVDVRLGQRVGYGVSSFVLASNLLNAGDAQFTRLEPRTFSGGVRFEH